MSRRREESSRGSPHLLRSIRWYFSRVYGRHDGPGGDLFYCESSHVGAFAVSPKALADGDDAAVFRLFVTLSMYQALRDEVIRRQQCSLARSSARIVADAAFVGRSISRHDCSALRSANTFERDCDVTKNGGVVDCGRHPGLRCHVKDATVVFNRMGDMGKLPSSAWLRLWRGDGLRKVLAEVFAEERTPTKRAARLVGRFAGVHRVGRKLSTMFVSALSTPALAPGLTPWFPEVDGNELVVVDTNVARAVDAMRPPGAPRTYDSRAAWIRDQAARIDLREFRADVPSYSPRLVQQALYSFCSKSNRVARGDPCAMVPEPCAECAPALCPFAPAPPRPVRRRREASASRRWPDAAP
jgi:hypothetical protein